jgi:hypothetical protein
MRKISSHTMDGSLAADAAVAGPHSAPVEGVWGNRGFPQLARVPQLTKTVEYAVK